MKTTLVISHKKRIGDISFPLSHSVNLVRCTQRLLVRTRTLFAENSSVCSLSLSSLFFSFAFRNLLRKWEGRSAWKNNVHFVHSILSLTD